MSAHVAAQRLLLVLNDDRRRLNHKRQGPLEIRLPFSEESSRYQLYSVLADERICWSPNMVYIEYTL